MPKEAHEQEFLKKTLKRLLDEMHQAQQRTDNASAGGFHSTIHKAVLRAKILFPENELVMNLNYEPPFGPTAAGPTLQSMILAYMVITVETLFDAIGWDFAEINRIPPPAPAPPPSLSVNQYVTQYNLQSTENVVNTVLSEVTSEKRAEAEALVTSFKDAARKGDKKAVWEIVKKLGVISEKAGLILFQHAVESGLFDWTKLPS